MMRVPVMCFIPLLLGTYFASDTVTTQSCDKPCSNMTCFPPYYGTCCHKKNIARDSEQTNQSSEYMERGRYFHSDLAVDGNTNTAFTSFTCTHTDPNSTDAYWMINLESTYNISEIKLYLRNNNADRNNGLKVQVDSTECFSLNKTFRSGATLLEDQIQHVHCSPPIPGSVVRVTVDTKILTLCEVQIFACDLGWYGEECDRQCNCRDSTDCDKTTGWCMDGCRAGKHGDGCQCDCEEGAYGLDCTESCGRCLDGKVCDKVNGSCGHECVQGFKPPLCKECDEFYHKSGDSCHTCGFCADNEPCNSTSGKCAGKCQAGYKQPLCKEDVEIPGVNHRQKRPTDCVPGRFGTDCRLQTVCRQCNVNSDTYCFTGGLCNIHKIEPFYAVCQLKASGFESQVL